MYGLQHVDLSGGIGGLFSARANELAGRKAEEDIAFQRANAVFRDLEGQRYGQATPDVLRNLAAETVVKESEATSAYVNAKQQELIRRGELADAQARNINVDAEEKEQILGDKVATARAKSQNDLEGVNLLKTITFIQSREATGDTVSLSSDPNPTVQLYVNTPPEQRPAFLRRLSRAANDMLSRTSSFLQAQSTANIQAQSAETVANINRDSAAIAADRAAKRQGQHQELLAIIAEGREVSNYIGKLITLSTSSEKARLEKAFEIEEVERQPVNVANLRKNYKTLVLKKSNPNQPFTKEEDSAFIVYMEKERKKRKDFLEEENSIEAEYRRALTSATLGPRAERGALLDAAGIKYNEAIRAFNKKRYSIVNTPIDPEQSWAARFDPSVSPSGTPLTAPRNQK